MHSLQSARPLKALSLGLLLAAANPKCALLAAAAGLEIGAVEATLRSAAWPIAVFTAVASVGVALPVLLYVVIGEPARRPVGKAKDWLERSNAAVTTVVITVIGCILLSKGGQALAR